MGRMGWGRTPVYQPALRSRAAKAVGRGAGRASLATVRAGYRHRSKLWPGYIALGCAVAAGVLHQADRQGWKTALVVAVLLGVLLGGRQLLAARRGQPWPVESLVLSWAALASAAGFTAWAAAIGPWAIPAPGFLVVGAVAAQMAWWWHRRPRPQPPGQDEQPDDDGEVDVDVIDQRIYPWVTRVSTTGGDGQPPGALPGSELHNVRNLPDGNLGWEALIQMLRGGTHMTGDAVAATDRIASAYDVPVGQVVEGLTSQARLLMLTRNVMRDVQRFTGPTYNPETGAFRFGMHADSSDALYRLHTPGSGACHGLVAGTTGAGKSGLVNQLCAEIRHSGNMVLCLADPEDGGSVPDWQDEGPHIFAGTLPKIRRMLQGVEREMNSRARRRSRRAWVDHKGRKRRGHDHFDPTRAEPLIQVVIDEAPRVLEDAECARVVAQIGKRGRKFGVGVHLIVQVPSLAELGNDLTIRSMVSSTNIIIFRTSDRLSKQMGATTDLPIDPASLPAQWPDGSATAGLGYLATVGARLSQLRANYVEDPFHWATTGDPCPLAEGRELRDVYDDEEDNEQAQAQAAAAGIAPAPEGTRARITALLLARGVPVRLGVIAHELGISKPCASNQLKRMRATGEVNDAGHGAWVHPQHVERREPAAATA